MTDHAPSPYDHRLHDDFEEQYRRILSVTQSKDQVDLAKFLGVKQSSISDAKRRSRVPADWLVTIFQKLRVVPDWIILGKGAKYAVDSTDEGKTLPHVMTTLEVKPSQECSAQELVNEFIRNIT